MKRESQSQYLERNGWYEHGALRLMIQGRVYGSRVPLWNHSDSDLREVNGFPMFKRIAVEKQRARDRRGL